MEEYMKRYVYLVLVLIVSCASAPHRDKVKQADANYELGLSYMREQKFQDAFVAFQKAIDLNPENKDAYNALGLIYLRFEELDKSAQSFEKAIDLDSNFSDARNNLGVVYSRQKKWEKAISEFDQALKNPLYVAPERAYYNLGNTYYRLKKYDLALKNYTNALRREPEFFPAYYGLALCYNATEEYGEASTAISLGIKKDPEIKGSKQKAVDVFSSRMVTVTNKEEKEDYNSLIEILHY
jgi:type IV pilus biogenesis/stability protein PilW